MTGLQPVLAKAQAADYEFLLGVIKSPVNFSGDSKLRELYDAYRRHPDDDARRLALTLQIEREVRYLGSAELAYLFRYIFRRDAGVEVDEIIRDVARRLKVQLKAVGTTEARLERLVKSVVERAVFKLSEAEQRELLQKHAIDPGLQDEIIRRIKEKGRIAVLPVLIAVLGQEAVAKLVSGLVISIIAQFLGREAAKKLVEHLIKRFPLWAEWLGPIAWGISAAWVVLDVQSPAYRKTVPVLLYCGLIGLRDGPEDGPEFWTRPPDDNE